MLIFFILFVKFVFGVGMNWSCEVDVLQKGILLNLFIMLFSL